MVIYNNLHLKERFKAYLQNSVKNLEKELVLEIIHANNDLASSKYIQIKQKIGESLGIQVNLHKYETVDKELIINHLKNVEKNKFGLIFQLPVPVEIDYLVSKTPLISDVDLLSENSSILWDGLFLPPTIGAIDLVLKDIFESGIEFPAILDQKLDLSSKIVCVVGQGRLVGGPLLRYLKDRNATIISINKLTESPNILCKQADIVISAAGSPDLIDSNWIKPGSIIIDSSTSEEGGKLVGDVKKDGIPEPVTISPSPGGIGNITVLYLFYNLYKLQKLEKSYV